MLNYVGNSVGDDGRERDLTLDELRMHLSQLELVGMPGNAIVQQVRSKGMKMRLRKFTVSDDLLRPDGPAADMSKIET